MGYALVKKDSAADNIKRIVNEELTEAINSLETIGQNKEETIHAIRKRIKKIRAVFRLIKSGMSVEAFRQENIRYRNIGHMLAHLRDATVMIKTLDNLKRIYAKAISRRAFAQARKGLVEKQCQISKDFFEDNNAIGRVLSAFKEAHQHLPDIHFDKDSFSVFADNLQTIYKRGIKALAVASDQPSMDTLHELRKEVKNLWYHTRIFVPLWPGFFQAYAQQLEVLSELLGDDHDLGVLAQEIESGKLPFGRKSTTSRFLTLIEERRKYLQQQIYPLANRVFAEKPRDFSDRYELYWKVWQGETRPA
ncbi:MAG: CHAD domain-containing protein [Bacteroidota bacterium]